MPNAAASTPTAVIPPPPTGAIASALGVASAEIQWLAGDGSDRCYYRVRAAGKPDPAVLMQLSGQDAEKLKTIRQVVEYIKKKKG